ncbi:MAG: efflux RND transporter permease subunit [Myxococcales bacterium]|nr:efflux RND transporter permease subunit [Myxococcales bacterium]
MRLSDLSIDRPVLASVMSLMIIVAGLVAVFALSVREYPDVDSPVVSVLTLYPGASPETVEATVTEPLEQVLNGIEGIRSVQSVSAFGESSIDVEFEAGRDIDLASTDVSNAVQRGLEGIPEEAERPMVLNAGANTRPIMWLCVAGENYNPVDLTDLADRIVKTPLQLLPGVAKVMLGGERRYAMRIWLDPASMAAHGIDAQDVRQTILDNNLQLPAGQIEAQARKYTIEADGVLSDPRDYERLVIRETEEIPVRIGDIGWVELGSENYQSITRFNGAPIVGIGIVRQSRANELAVSHAVREALPAIRAALPEDVQLYVAVDNTIFVEASLIEVAKTLGIAFVLVVLVNLFFLRSKTTTSIAAVAIPISLIGTFAIMQVLEFSLNVLTLLALVLAIGLLVDDAIVVMENIFRRQETGEAPLRAAKNGAREVGFPVIATTVSVVAVLIPLSLMTGGTGRLFREFSLVMAGAVVISTFVALSLVPMLCSRFLDVKRREGRLALAIERFLARVGDGYARILETSLANRALVDLILLFTAVGTGLLFWLLPHTFVPIEDRGSFLTLIRAPQGSTAAYTDRALQQVQAAMAETEGVAGYFSAIGLGIGGPPNTSDGIVFTRLLPWGERDAVQQQIVGALFPRFLSIPDALVFPINMPSLGQLTLADVQIVVKSSSAQFEEFVPVMERLAARAAEVPGLVNVDTDLRLENPQLSVIFHRERSSDVGVPMRTVAEALRLLVSQNKTDEFVLRNKQYDVVMALSPRFRSTPEQLTAIHVRARDGSMVPIGSLVDLVPGIGPTTLNHYDLQRSAMLTGNLAQNASLGPVLDQVQRIVDEELPSGFSSSLAGISREFLEASGLIYFTFLVALVVIYLVLAAQFESFVHPLTILLSVPLATFGALATLAASYFVFKATNNSMNLYSQIGVVLLVGLVTKNSILIVDFANQARARGVELLEALGQAGRIRFRPILMTSATSILGALPLALATGAGAESRRPIGAAVVGGLLFSTVFTLVVTPVLHHGIVRTAERLGLRTIPPLVALDEVDPGEVEAAARG